MRKWWIIGIVFTVVVAAALAFLVFSSTAVDSVTLGEATASIEEQYGGTIENTTETEEFYQIQFKRENGQYLATVNRGTGQVASLEQLAESEPSRQLSEEQASQAALAAESGELKDSQYMEESNSYTVEIESENERKTLQISAADGKVLDVQKERLETPTEPADNPVVPPAPEKEPERIISQQAAIAIAKETLNGEVDEIEFVQTADGGYYLVEIDHEASDREATIQIHAIRGEAMTVEWDD